LSSVFRETILLPWIVFFSFKETRKPQTFGASCNTAEPSVAIIIALKLPGITWLQDP
jgi:hypothetical protein